MLWRLAIETVGVGIERVVLQILKQAAVILTGAALGSESNIADLRKLCAVVKRRYSHAGDSFLRRVGIL